MIMTGGSNGGGASLPTTPSVPRTRRSSAANMSASSRPASIQLNSRLRRRMSKARCCNKPLTPSESNAIYYVPCRPTETYRGLGPAISERFAATCTTTSGAEHGPGRDAQYSATRGEGAPATTSTGYDADTSPFVIEWREPAAVGVERYRPRRMVARHLSCRAPSGGEFPIILLGDVVIAPEMACKEPGLGWLELEAVPRLSM